MGWLAPVVITGLVVVVLGFFFAVRYISRINAARRDDEAGPKLAELARQRGWGYVAEDAVFADRVTCYPVYARSDHGARGEKSRQLVHGLHRGREFGFFQYRTDSSDASESGSSRYFRVFAVDVPASAPMPHTFISGADSAPRFPRREKVVSTNDSQFESECYSVSDDMNFASALLCEPVRQLFTHDPRVRELSLRVEMSGHVVCHAYEQKEQLDISTIEPTLDFLCDFLDRVPGSLLR